MKSIVVCSILKDEINAAMEELALHNNLVFIDAALHVDNSQMENALKGCFETLKNAEEEASIIVGTKCHPDICKMACDHRFNIMPASNCIEMLIGDKMAELCEEAKTFFLTVGWLKNWRRIFVEGLKWDQIDGRINFGCYDRILLLDTGLCDIPEELIIEFYEFTEVPIDTYSITLDYFKEELKKLLA